MSQKDQTHLYATQVKEIAEKNFLMDTLKHLVFYSISKAKTKCCFQLVLVLDL